MANFPLRLERVLNSKRFQMAHPVLTERDLRLQFEIELLEVLTRDD